MNGCGRDRKSLWRRPSNRNSAADEPDTNRSNLSDAMQLIEAFVKNPVKVSVAVLLVILFGTISLFNMPIQLTPEVQIPTITVETVWRGASPQEIEREIIQEQEEQLKAVEGVVKMTSESMDSLGRITLEFQVGTVLSEALLKVNTRLQQVLEYPEDADEPVLNTANLSDRPIAWFVLSQGRLKEATIDAFEAKHPDLTDELERVRHARNPALAMFRLRKLALGRPEVQEIVPERIDIPTLRTFAEDVLEARLERVPGVANANVLGGREEELQVVIDPERLAARQLTIGDVRAALRSHNQDTSGGDLWEGKRRYVIRTLGRFRDPEHVANAILARRAGEPVYVRDVAQVRLGFKKPDGIVRRFGDSCLAMNAVRETGANVLDVMEGLRKAVAELNERVLQPRGLELLQVYDETEYIYSAIDLVTDNILIGAVLTFATLLLFLRSVGSTWIIFVHIAVSTVGAFLAMGLLGRSLNVPALGGLAFAVGMLVDNAIVMLENIYRRHVKLGEPADVASVRGAKEVWGALLNATIANLAVFLPVLFIKDQAGQLFRDIALAISASVSLSMFVAVAVVPPTAARLLRRVRSESESSPVDAAYQSSAEGRHRSKPHTVGGGRTAPTGGRLTRLRQFVSGGWLRPLDALGRSFVTAVVGTIQWWNRGLLRRLIGVIAIIGIATGLSVALLPKAEYLPGGNRNLTIGILLPPPGYNLDQLVEIGAKLEEDLRPYWDIDLGTPEEARLEFPAIADFFCVARGRQLFLGLRSADPMRAGELAPLVQSAVGAVPGTIVVSKQVSLFEAGLTAGRTIDIEITGPDISRLVVFGGQVMGQVRQVVPGAQAIPQPSLDLSSPELHVVPKWDQAADMGMTAVELGYAVDALIDGAYATDFYKGGNKIDLSILGQDRFVQRTQDLDTLPVVTPSGEQAPLKAVADVQLSSGPEQINHRERQRAITIQVTPPPAVALEDAMQRIDGEIVRPLVSSGQLTDEYRINLSGTVDKLRATWHALRLNLLLAVLITYLFMAATFESWLYPFVVMLSVPLGAMGGIAGLWMLNLFVLQPLDVLTMLGFVMLVGTVVNNPILIVEQALVHIREDAMSPNQAVVESVRNRIRPIFMTTLGGLVGLFPLVVAPGAGSELYRGIGAVLLGGMLVSTPLTLFFVPIVFTLMVELRTIAARLSKSLRQATRPRPDQTDQDLVSTGHESAETLAIASEAMSHHGRHTD